MLYRTIRVLSKLSSSLEMMNEYRPNLPLYPKLLPRRSKNSLYRLPPKTLFGLRWDPIPYHFLLQDIIFRWLIYDISDRHLVTMFITVAADANEIVSGRIWNGLKLDGRNERLEGFGWCPPCYEYLLALWRLKHHQILFHFQTLLEE